MSNSRLVYSTDGGRTCPKCGWPLTNCQCSTTLSAGKDAVAFDTSAGRLSGVMAGDKRVTVDMGEPRLSWEQIPLAEEMDTRGIELQVGPIDAPLVHTPVCVSMGNPHVVIAVDDVDTAPVETLGPAFQRHPAFPESVNVGFMQRESERGRTLDTPTWG